MPLRHLPLLVAWHESQHGADQPENRQMGVPECITPNTAIPNRYNNLSSKTCKYILMHPS